METTHRVYVGDSRSMDRVDDDAVDLVVTSPPYPMVEMWDDPFAELDSEIGDHLDRGDGDAAFESMHDVLFDVWSEVARVLAPGGVACVNVGDATRTVGGSFQVYPNHVAVTDAFRRLGFQPLPDILWRKPTNSAAKFMGSGMLPPNAYATLEHEYVLVFRNGPGRREFEPGSDRRYESAYFWEERNEWFSDVWTDVNGAFQELADDDLRERSAAFPLELPYRLVNMYSVYGDTVLDPFWGTGTTSLAAMAAARDSVGYEVDAEFTRMFADRVAGIDDLSRRIARTRLADHREFVADRVADDSPPKYDAEHYDFPVTTKQERRVRFYAADDVRSTETGYEIEHVPVEGEGEGADGS